MKLKWPLLAIDALILIAFSYGGLKFHYQGDALFAEVLRVIWPFTVGFLAVGLALKAYEPPKSAMNFAIRSSLVWLLGMASGFFLRGLQRGAMPSLLFIKIAMAFTGVLMLIGRGAFGFYHYKIAKPK